MNYCGGEKDSKYATLLSELMAFQAKSSIYKPKWEAITMITKVKAASVVEELDEEQKDDPTSRLIACLQLYEEMGTGRQLFESLRSSPA